MSPPSKKVPTGTTTTFETRDGNGTDPASIHKIPDEILMKICHYLSSHDLLNTCRLVSKRWNQISTHVCHQHLVKCRSSESRDFYEGIVSTITDSVSIPWSSMDLKLHRPFVTSSFGFLQKFGPVLKQLTLTVSVSNYNNLLKALTLTPNLQDLKISALIRSTASPKFAIQADTKVMLPKLKELAIHFNSYSGYSVSVDFLKLILKNSHDRLTFFEFHVDSDTILSGFEGIVQVLIQHKVKSLSLNLPYNGPNAGWKLLAAQRSLNVTALEVRSSAQVQVIDEAHFLPLYHFLVTNSKTLKALKLSDFCNDEPGLAVSKLLLVPTLPNLETLSLLFGDEGGPTAVQFHPFTPLQFPSLEKVTIRSHNPDKGTDWVDFHEIFGANSYPGVISLEIECYGGLAASWIRIFPNLVDVSAWTFDAFELVECFKRLGSVESLSLFMHTREDVNTALQEAFSLFLDTFQGGGLKKLTVRNVCTCKDKTAHTNVLREWGALLLNLLPPLDLIIMKENTKLSEDCISQLRVRHPRFQLKEKL